MEILVYILLLCVGVVIGVLIQKVKKTIPFSQWENAQKELSEREKQISIFQERIRMQLMEMQKQETQLESLQEAHKLLEEEMHSKEADLRIWQGRFQAQKQELEQTRERLQKEFRLISEQILEENRTRISSKNKEDLENILNPLREKIGAFEKSVRESYEKETKERFSLIEEIKRLNELNQSIGAEARNLTKALKGDNKSQGNWGEMILESILEKSGLVKGREYEIQASEQNEDGRRLQPDVLVHYPGDKLLVIDSKVSLVDYDKYYAASTEEERNSCLKAHIQSIRRHAQQLSSKNYQDLFKDKSLDFVMLFMPIEPAYLLAIHEDPDLWQYAYDKKILLISPTNLIAALKMIANLWQHENQNKNVMEIARQSGALYDKFDGLLSDFLEMGKKIDQLQTGHGELVKKLSTGRGNLISRVEKIKELGAKTKKSLPLERFDV